MDHYLSNSTDDAPVSAGSASPAGGSGRILVVEDDSTIQRLITTMLEVAGYRVVCAGDGEAGWDVLIAGTFDLLILDNNMPRLSGIDLLRRLRAIPLNLPVLLISGDLPKGEKDFAALVTPGVALSKPFSMAQLLGHVRAHLVPVGSAE